MNRLYQDLADALALLVVAVAVGVIGGAILFGCVTPANDSALKETSPAPIPAPVPKPKPCPGPCPREEVKS
jgi:hypothetical protein